MSTDALSFAMSQIVYLKIDPEEKGMVTGILFRPGGCSYAVTWASSIEESFHYEMELVADKAFASTSN